MQNQQCAICGSTATVGDDYRGGTFSLTCPRCGRYEITNLAGGELSTWSHTQKSNLSGWIRENPGFQIVLSALGNLKSLRTPPVGEKADKLLLSLARNYPKAGTRIPLFKESPTKTSNVAKYIASVTGLALPAVLGQAWAEDEEELIYIVVEYLVKAKNFLQDADGGHYKITPVGWAYIHGLTHGTSQGDTGFIAMWFAPDMEPAHLAIQEGIKRAGYKPLRIDGKEHNNKIDDEIIAALRRSKFVVADFTGHRGGVYYEAGYAGGRDIPVIWLCRRDDMEKLHFDTRQYSHILWDKDNLEELTNSLLRRVEATIGHGPIEQS